MGILNLLFVGNSLDENYLCDSCEEILDDPMILDPCDHAVCKSCLKNVAPASVTPTMCPVEECGQQIAGERKAPQVFTNLLNKLVIDCPLIDDGCYWRGKLGELHDHRRTCEYKANDCKAGCGAKFPKKEEKNHSCIEYLKKKLKKMEKKVERKRRILQELDPGAQSSGEESDEDEHASTSGTSEKLERKRKRAQGVAPGAQLSEEEDEERSRSKNRKATGGPNGESGGHEHAGSGRLAGRHPGQRQKAKNTAKSSSNSTNYMYGHVYGTRSNTKPQAAWPWGCMAKICSFLPRLEAFTSADQH